MKTDVPLIDALQLCKDKKALETVFARYNIGKVGDREKTLREAMGDPAISFKDGYEPNPGKRLAAITDIFMSGNWRG
ncbi:MAG: hypothetical protein LBH81_02085 [Rickettsiales bacterium]|jgi:hypothetical protein|nr:hypothetical protein [Rickettsiales bacterium]